ARAATPRTTASHLCTTFAPRRACPLRGDNVQIAHNFRVRRRTSREIVRTVRLAAGALDRSTLDRRCLHERIVSRGRPIAPERLADRRPLVIRAPRTRLVAGSA